jgi:hypothetical protein
VLFIVTTNKPSCSQFIIILLFERVVIESEGKVFKRTEIMYRIGQREEMNEEKWNERKQHRQLAYNITLRGIRIAIFHRKQQLIFCMLLSCMSLSTVKNIDSCTTMLLW